MPQGAGEYEHRVDARTRRPLEPARAGRCVIIKGKAAFVLLRRGTRRLLRPQRVTYAIRGARRELVHTRVAAGYFWQLHPRAVEACLVARTIIAARSDHVAPERELVRPSTIPTADAVAGPVRKRNRLCTADRKSRVDFNIERHLSNIVKQYLLPAQILSDTTTVYVLCLPVKPYTRLRAPALAGCRRYRRAVVDRRCDLSHYCILLTAAGRTSRILQRRS